MARAIATLRAGKSRGQQNQAFMDKVILHGGTAALGAMANAAKGAESFSASQEREENARKSGIMSRAITHQTARAGN